MKHNEILKTPGMAENKACYCYLIIQHVKGIIELISHRVRAVTKIC
jgi:hypothetical protein